MSAPIPTLTRTLADFGGSTVTDGGRCDELADKHPRVRRDPEQVTIADPDKVGVTLSTTSLPDSRPEPIANRKESTFLTRENISGQERINIKVCPLCGRQRGEWIEDIPSEHFARDDHDWAALERARATIEGVYDA